MMIKRFLQEMRSYSIHEKIFIGFVMLCGFCITSEYAITKPVSYSVFISHFSTAYFPYAWLAIMPLNFLVVIIYNRLLPKLGCFYTMASTALCVIAINILACFYLKGSPVFSFAHFVWKDIYVLLMFQHVWSVIHATLRSHKAKYLYGVIYGVGGIGSVVGSCIPGFFAIELGSEPLLFCTPILYLMLIGFYKVILHTREKIQDAAPIEWKKTEATGGFALIHRSRYLKVILLVVVFMQLAATLIDFQFNSYLEMEIPDKDWRTQYSGRIFGMIHFINIFLQFFGAAVVLHLLGLKKSHLVIPALFMCNMIGCIAVPAFQMMTLCFATIKAFDYSIFSIVKEMLYLPLKLEEKFKAKAVIDVFAYRSSKALASFAVLALQWLHLRHMSVYINWVLLGIFLLWIGVILRMFREQTFKQLGYQQTTG